MAIVTCLWGLQFLFQTLCTFCESEKVACVSWSINWSWFCPRLPGRLAALMKLLNEAERGHLCSHPDDHACRWHGQRRWHLGVNYPDFTPARVWIKPVLSDGWVLRDITPKPSHLWPPGTEMTDSKVKGKQMKTKVVGKKSINPFVLQWTETWESWHVAAPPSNHSVTG